MLRDAKKISNKILAGFLALLLGIGVVPSNVIPMVFAAEVAKFEVELPVEITANVTMTNESETSETFTVKAEKGVAIFENVIDTENVYTLSITGMEEYKDYSQTGVLGDAEGVVVSALEEKSERTISFKEDAITKVYGDAEFSVELAETVTGELEFVSTNEQVATVDSTGKVTVCGAGETQIKVNLLSDDTYKSATDVLTLTVEPAEGALSYAVTAVNWIYKDVKTNPLTVKDGAVGTTTYKSSDASVASVDKNSGEVTILKPGIAEITAEFKAGTNSNYKDSTASYQIVAEKKANSLRYEKAEISDEYGDSAKNTLSVPEDVTGSIVYSSTKESVATVDAKTGKYQIIGMGETVISASLSGDANYADCSASYTLSVEHKQITLTVNATNAYGKEDPDLTEAIKKAVAEKLVLGEGENAEIVARVAGKITYSYVGVEEGQFRPAGESEITFVVTNDDANYNISVNGKLTVSAPRTPEKESIGSYYTVKNRIGDWGSVVAPVTIIAAEGCKVSKSDKKVCADWKDEIDYAVACDVMEHMFYVRNATGEVFKCTENFGVDGTNPIVKFFDFKLTNDSSFDKALHYLSFGIFFNEAVKVTVTATDDASGLDTITLYNDNKEVGTEVVEDGRAVFTLPVEYFEKLQQISAIAADKVGNTSEKTFITQGENGNLKYDKGLLLLENKRPEITMETSEEPYMKEEEAWYGKDEEIKVTVSDKGENNSGIRSVKVTINGIEVAIDKFNDDNLKPNKNAENGPSNYWFYDEYQDEIQFTINTSLLVDDDRPNDGKFVIEVTVVDNAGNPKTSTTIDVKDDKSVDALYIDESAPSVTQFEFVGTGKNEEKTVTETKYGYFFQNETAVKVHAIDPIPTSGMSKIEYYTVDYSVDDKGVKSAVKTIDYGTNIMIAARFRGQIYARAIDNVGHGQEDSVEFVHPYGTVIEPADSHKEHAKATATILTTTTHKDNKNQDLYALNELTDEKGLQVKLEVSDTFSGIGSVTWQVTIPGMGIDQRKVVIEETLNIENYLNQDIPDDIEGWTIVDTHINLVTKMERVIRVDDIIQEGNDIRVEVFFTDRAGNRLEDDAHTSFFSIDKTKPEINITYKEELKPDEKYNTIYKENRTMVVTITETNFRAKDIVAKIENTDGVIPQIDWTLESKWSLKEGTTDQHVIEIPYMNDGDYIFNIAYTDNAGLKADSKEVAFTIDTTDPIIESVVYDNTNVANSNYYKADRTATITIKEHNFDPERVTSLGVVSDNGTSFEFPVLSAWESKGNDRYSATIAYNKDGKYTFDIAVLDMAGNSIKDYEPVEFYIDKTKPVIEISGVENLKPYNDKVAPIIKVTDTNFDKEKVTIDLKGANTGYTYKDEFKFTTEDIENGQQRVYQNFGQKQVYDDIYTLTVSLTDKAGNTTPQTIQFSVNRFGSVYDLSGLSDIIDKYLQEEKDIVFTETNVDPLDMEQLRVKLTKDGTPIDLVVGEDLTIEETSVNGGWKQYKYTIKKALFAKDGKYSISVYSVDKAGNINENEENSKNAVISFGIDKTRPVIVAVDFESGKQYDVPEKIVTLQIKDNLVLADVKILLNGDPIVPEVNGESYTFKIPEMDQEQTVEIIAKDASGRERVLEVIDFLVTTNRFVQWYYNTPLFVGSIIGVVVVGAGITALIIFKKKKKANK